MLGTLLQNSTVKVNAEPRMFYLFIYYDLTRKISHGKVKPHSDRPS